jgi:hypothetical protein
MAIAEVGSEDALRADREPRVRRFDVYGLGVALEGDWPEVLDELAVDFGWFAASAVAADVTVEVLRRSPDYDRYASIPAAFVTPRNVVYQEGARTVLDYSGRALGVYDRAARRLRIESEDHQLAREAGYLFLLSRIGEHVDAVGLPRAHGLGLAGAQGGVLLLLPAGGGKSTLCLRALREGSRLLSEDSPLIDRQGRIHPFPLHIGINEGDVDSLPDAPVRRVERMEFHPKLLLDIRAFADQVERTPQPLRHVVVGRRSLGRTAKLEPLPRRAAVGPLLRESVVGVGLYQGMEFVLQRGLRDLSGKVGLVATRSACCAAALAHARVWRLTLGRDHDANWDALRSLLT